MSVSVKQKVKILPVLILLGLVIFLEHVGVFLKYFVRLGFLGLVFMVLFKAFPLEVKEPTFYRYSDFSIFSTYSNTYQRQVPYKIKEVPLPDLSARSFIVVDVNTDHILLENKSHKRLAPASTTKLMTALVALDLYAFEETLAVPEFCTTVEGTKLGLFAHEEVLFRDLLYGLLVSSSNDVACVLSNFKVPSFEFIALMNEKAEAFELLDTHFTNSVGLDGAVGAHYSSAYDLYLLAKKVLENDFVRDVVKTKEYETTSGEVLRKIYTTNYLLWAIPESAGVKTGRTEAAGEVLIYEYKDDLKDVIIVVMGSEDRFLDTRKLLDWVLFSYSWET